MFPVVTMSWSWTSTAMRKKLTIVATALLVAFSNVAAGAAGEMDIASACRSTLYPSACVTALSSLAPTAGAKKPETIFHVSVEFAKSRAILVREMALNMTTPSAKRSPNPSGASGSPPSSVDDCLELLDATLEQLDDVLHRGKKSSFDDVHTWVSSALTNQVTCTESLETVPVSGAHALAARVQVLSEHVSNSLALHKMVKGESGGEVEAARIIAVGGRKLLSDDVRFPAWLSAATRRLLEASPEEIKADAVVAQDGSGTHTTISEAIAYVSLASSDGGTKVIHVKAGTYKENVNVPLKQKYVTLMGDGKGKSIIVGSRNVYDGYSTFNSATVVARGEGFMAKGLTIINDSGPNKHQAVALRVDSDKSVIYDCSIQGYQDTLYSHSGRQFYTECDIYGTVDFIFGNSAVVLQNCNIQLRKPARGQMNSVTAQGRPDPNQDTGISIQKCKIRGSPELTGTPSYLGRPWQNYSRTVVMQTNIDGSIAPAGWEPWSGSFALSTLFYGEYKNTGRGASTSGRVGWAGVHPSLSSSEASKFTVGKFIAGDRWLPDTGVTYDSGL